MLAQKVRRVAGLRERVDIMEARTAGVAVAVRQIMGTEG